MWNVGEKNGALTRAAAEGVRGEARAYAGRLGQARGAELNFHSPLGYFCS